MSRRPFAPSTTYTLAHTAQCKLQIAANRPDRNLRFVLGHAFTLDNLMLRIVEIENQSAKSAFQEGNKPPSEHGGEQYDCTAASSHNAPKSPEAERALGSQTEPTPAEPDPTSRGRRISFQDNHARPSRTAGVGSNNGSPSSVKRSPPPSSVPFYAAADDGGSSDTTSSDDYDDPETVQYEYNAHSPKRRGVHDAYSDEEDATLELADDELEVDDAEDDGLGLQRFASASAQPPRMVRSRASSSSSSEDDDRNGPVSPPQLPTDLDVKEIVQGDQDAELTDLYESVRRCTCHGQRDKVGGPPAGVWDVPVEKTGGRRMAVVALTA